MGRVIPDSVQGDFPPMVGLRTVGNYVKGKVTGKSQTSGGNPVITLSLIDLDGSTSKSVSKGVYEEVEVNAGDSVQLIGSAKQLREKIAKLNIGEVVTVRFDGKRKLAGGRSLNQFHVEVDE